MNRPPTKAAVDTIRARFNDNHPGDVSFGHEDIDILLRYIDYQETVMQGHVEDLRDAGRELREMQAEIANLERQVVTW